MTGSPASDRPTVRQYVSVRARPTVVRLEDREASWIDDYYVTAEVARHIKALDVALDRPNGTGVFVIGPYGSGKSHLLAWLARRLSDRADPQRVVATSMLAHPSTERLEAVLGRAVGVDDAPDRRPGWTAAVEGGLVLLIDELSEFLRSKPDTRAFNEDVRFLQFLGELAITERLVIVAAMQEQIEHTGELDVGLYRKIRDRFPVRLQLGPVHTREVLARGVLDKLPGSDEAIAPVARRLREALPDHPVDEGLLTAIYPIHPATLELLDEVRDRFSQTRGAVEFVVTQLRGDATRDVTPFLDEPWGSFVTPDRIVEHFYDVLRIQAEFLPLHEQLFPWWQSEGHQLFETATLRTLAERVLRLLALVWLSPRREALTADDALAWLLLAASRTDPGRNRAIVARVLETLASNGRYVRSDDGQFRLDFDDDSSARLEGRLKRELAALAIDDETLFAALIERSEALPDFPIDRWAPHEITWHHHRRSVRVWLGNGEPSPISEPGIVVRLPWGAPEAVARVDTILPERIVAGDEERTALVLRRLREEPSDARMRERIERRLRVLEPRIHDRVRTAMAQAEHHDADGGRTPSPLTGPVSAWLDALFIAILERIYPSFPRFAPTAPPVPKAGWLELARAAAGGRLTQPSSDTWLNVVREGYLVPMKLLKRRHGGFERRGDPGRHDIVRRLSPLLPRHPEIKTVYEHLAQPVYGLVEDQVHALLITLVFVGEIEIIKEGRGSSALTYREAFEAMPLPSSYDRVRPTRALPGEALQQLEEICRALSIDVPRSWTVTAQSSAVGSVREALGSVVRGVGPIASQLEGTDGGEQLVEDIRAFAEHVRNLEGSDDIEAFERFRKGFGSVSELLDRYERLRVLPERLDRQAKEVQRYRHLLAGDDTVAPPPPLHDGPAIERWLHEARITYAERAERYRAAHEAFWAAVDASSVLEERPPAVSRSALVGRAAQAAKLDALFERARRVRCRKLVDLSFQPRCTCGFDGERAGISSIIDAIGEERRTLEEGLVAAFADPDIAARVRDWLASGPERAELARAWLDGEAAWPEVHDIDGLDRLFEDGPRILDLDAAVSRLGDDRVWSSAELGRALSAWASSLGPGRFRIGGSPEVAAWCVARCLETGEPLPKGISGASLDELPVGPSAEALRGLESLGLAEPLVVEVARRVAEGLAVPHDASPLVLAAGEIARPSVPTSPESVGLLAARLYRAHERLQALGPGWLERLDAVARGAGVEEPPELVDLLKSEQASTWWVDAFGLAMLPGLRGALPGLVPGFRLDSIRIARVLPPTTTDACRTALAEAGIPLPVAKCDTIDVSLHRLPRWSLDRMIEVALPDLRRSGRRVAEAAAPGMPILLFADHGFRLDHDGTRWVHGGDSALERWVPVIRYVPG